MQNGILMVAGGFNWNGSFNETCYQLKNGSWQINTTLKTSGRCTPDNMVITDKAGADYNGKKVRYLPKNSKNWRKEKNTEIPKSFILGCAVEIKSKGEIWLIGGEGKETSKRILSFNLEDHTFKQLPMKLKIGRSCHKCTITKIGNSEVILITGGLEKWAFYQNFVEIIDIETGKVTLTSPMNKKRVGHGIGTLNINNQSRICVFGGWNGSSKENTIEAFDKETLKWELVTDFKMNEAKSSFGFLTI